MESENGKNEGTWDDFPKTRKDAEEEKYILKQSTFVTNTSYDYIPRKYRSGQEWIPEQIDRPDIKVFKNNCFNSQQLCLKVICCGDDEERFNRAVRECEITELLRGNQGIVWLLDCDINPENKTVALLEEREHTLSEYFDSESLSPFTMVHIGTGILDALIQIQKAGFLYLDVHPGNLYYNEKRVKIGDFGSVVKLDEVNNYQDLTGVRSFMAPEVWKERTYSIQSVLYNTGMVLYWILNRCTPPFLPIRSKEEAFEKRMAGDLFPIPQFLLKFPEEMKELYKCIQRMTAYNPSDRYETFEEARNALALVGYEYCLRELEEDSSKAVFVVGQGDYEKTVFDGTYNSYNQTISQGDIEYS